MPQFIQTPVTAEQHALDNPGHVVSVFFQKILGHDDTEIQKLVLDCQGCDWWDEQLF